MRKIIVMLCVCVCVAAVLPAQARAGGTMYVAAKTVELKNGTGFFASTTGALEYGAAVSVLQINGKWAEVRSTAGTSISGWTAVGNLSAKRIISGDTADVTAREVSLAGKGFNQEIENAYKADGNLNYADVDITEAQNISKQELQDFIVEGRLFAGDRN